MISISWAMTFPSLPLNCFLKWGMKASRNKPSPSLLRFANCFLCCVETFRSMGDAHAKCQKKSLSIIFHDITRHSVSQIWSKANCAQNKSQAASGHAAVQTHTHTHTHVLCWLYPETSALQALFNHVGLAALITMSAKVSPCCYLLILQLLQPEEHAPQASVECLHTLHSTQSQPAW